MYGRSYKPRYITPSPDNLCVQRAAAHDFHGFMRAELSDREALGYPPYGRMLLLRLWGPKLDRVRQAAEDAAEALREPVAAKGIQLLGPAPSPISLVRKKYRYQVLLKMPPRFPVGDVFPPLLRPLRDLARKAGVRLEADVDPYHLMV